MTPYRPSDRGIIRKQIVRKSLADGQSSRIFTGGLALVTLAFAGAARGGDQRVIELALHKRQIDGGARVVRVTQGDKAELRWIADEPASLHLHGYDLHASPAPGAPSIMLFSARTTGRFPVTAHGFAGEHAHTGGHREQTLIYLEVHPR